MTVTLALPFQERRLDNGLRVLVHEDHHLPLVAVNVWYHVGSRNERPGRTGFAHLFEHLMFEGSAHVPAGRFDQLLEAAGAINNGSTSPDRTNYWETLPSNAFELALYLESDRMGWLAETMTQAKLDGQRDVVMNERRQSYENRPYGLAHETLLAALYPPDHPYHWPVIGSMADLAAATLDDVVSFFRTYYTPGNASLAVAGAIEAERAFELAERYFGGIPAGGAVPETVVRPAALPEERRLILEDDVQLARLYLAWHSPPRFAAGDAEHDMAAHVLAHGKAGRLYRRLVHELELAQEVDAFQDSGLLGSAFFVEVTARPDVRLGDIERIVRDEIAALADAGPDESELERVRNVIETAFVDALQTVGGFGGRADRLNMYAFFVSDPGYVADDLRRYRDATSGMVAAALRRSTADTAPAALHVVPRGRRDLAQAAGRG
jgi:zinc protease